MKKILSLLFVVSIVLASGTIANAQSKLIHYWHFNNYTIVDSVPVAPVNANYSMIDTMKAQIHYKENAGVSSAYMAYADFYTTTAADGDTFNVKMGVPSGNAFRTRNPSDSMSVLFFMPTVGFKNIELNYGTQASNGGSGQKLQVYSYSVDSGLTWRTSGLSIPSDSALPNVFKLVTVAFSDTQVNNNAKFVFRIIYSGNTTGTSGNNRFDNVSLEGDTIARTTAIEDVATVPFTIFPNPAGNTLTISTTNTAVKTVAIVNMNGQTVIATTAKESKFPVNIANIAAGMYYITVTETATGKKSTMKFVKQ